MNWITKLERKYGRYAIANLTLYIIACYAIGYILQFSNNNILNYFTLNPYKILHGQVWRIVTWIIVPPEGFGFTTLIMLYFYYSIGTALERAWGTFRYNVYIISGLLFTVIGAFLLYACVFVFGINDLGAEMEAILSVSQAYEIFFANFTTAYICMSIILAFSATFPDMPVYLFFVLPIKMKVLGIIDALILAYDFFISGMMVGRYKNTLFGYVGLAKCFAILFSLMNFLIFFITTRKSFRTPSRIKRQREYKGKIVRAQKIAKHKCAICGRSQEEYPELDFRFCSKCEGNYEYCQDHLFTHKHVTK